VYTNSKYHLVKTNVIQATERKKKSTEIMQNAFPAGLMLIQSESSHLMDGGVVSERG
jgi:hypothetical protein